ncbi:TrkH family potassium uptake protein [Cohaesibacter sp. ES.047]|uniref:TrkH family potassium uptake protein n=1 Tax=Cohaesibacter sp. ES.047 TaxID=1798205 RepID=UPI001FCE7E22|nr:TrkH family potassium uptake protein [Cohaesibacter sp. ES.047]
MGNRQKAKTFMLLDIRPVLMVIGTLLSVLGIAMFIPALLDLALGDKQWRVFAASGGVTVFVGGGLWMATRKGRVEFTRRQAFVMTVLSWTSLAAFGALPLLWSGAAPTYTDAFFESMSGITTTGSTVLSGLDQMQAGVLLWRGIMQWLGGLGVIVMAIAVLPMLQVGGMQLFQAEAFSTAEKILPRATQISAGLTGLYIVFTAVCALLYHLAGMTALDAIIHGMTTVATGGLSSHDNSIGHYDSARIEIIAIVFMIIGSLPFILYIQALRGQILRLTRDSEIRAFLAILAFFTIIASFYAIESGTFEGLDAVRHAAFNVVSVVSGTGYSSTDYQAWGPFSLAFFFFIMFIGGCQGSTACGLKVFRLQVTFQVLKQHINRIVFPNGVFVKKYAGMPLGDDVSAAVMSFFFLYVVSFLVLGILLQMTGLDLVTALSGAGTAIANVGPGVGHIIGPAGNFQPLSDVAKWLLSFGMLLGRLELLTMLVLFLPRFWME